MINFTGEDIQKRNPLKLRFCTYEMDKLACPSMLTPQLSACHEYSASNHGQSEENQQSSDSPKRHLARLGVIRELHLKRLFQGIASVLISFGVEDNAAGARQQSFKLRSKRPSCGHHTIGSDA